MNSNNLDLAECDTPEAAIRVLRNAAQRFYEDASELQSAWRDKNPDIVFSFWARLARDLDRLADRAEKYT